MRTHWNMTCIIFSSYSHGLPPRTTAEVSPRRPDCLLGGEWLRKVDFGNVKPNITHENHLKPLALAAYEYFWRFECGAPPPRRCSRHPGRSKRPGAAAHGLRRAPSIVLSYFGRVLYDGLRGAGGGWKRLNDNKNPKKLKSPVRTAPQPGEGTPPATPRHPKPAATRTSTNRSSTAARRRQRTSNIDRGRPGRP